MVLDTSPGVRYWSLNALALSDILFLTLKMGDVDIDGTKKDGQRNLQFLYNIWLKVFSHFE